MSILRTMVKEAYLEGFYDGVEAFETALQTHNSISIEATKHGNYGWLDSESYRDLKALKAMDRKEKGEEE